MPTIRFNALDTSSVQSAITELQRLGLEQQQRINDACMDLAFLGATQASLDFARTPYDGNRDVSISVEEIPFGAKITASGESVLFLEYGSGATMGYGHPRSDGYGPGTYNPLSSKWRNPKGWWYGNRQHTYGNPPAMAMWNAEQVVIDRANEVLNGVMQ